MADWIELTLGELADIQTGPFGSQLHASDYVDYGIPSIMPKDIGQRLNINLDSIAYISEEDAQRLERYRVKPTDLVFSRRGDVEKCAYITDDMDGWLCGTGCLKASFLPDVLVLPKFMAYYVSTRESKHWLSAHAVGTTMPNLNSTILGNFPVELPSLREQEAITAVLASLDDKIDLLYRQNKTLESMAQTLFRHWFIDGTADDWEEGVIPDEFDFTMGLSPPGNSYNEDGNGIPMFQGNADFGFRFPENRVYTTDARRFAEKYDTLISVRAPVGAQNMAFEKCCIGRGVAAFRYRKNHDYYTYTYFKLHSLMDEIRQFNDEGTVFGSIGKADFLALQITIPPDEVINQFQTIAKPIDDKVIENCKQINTLEKLRDTLLPKLMSGEVRVRLS